MYATVWQRLLATVWQRLLWEASASDVGIGQQSPLPNLHRTSALYPHQT